MMGGFIVQTIKVLNFRGFAGKIDRLGGVSLHAKCKFIGCNSGCKGGICGVGSGMPLIPLPKQLQPGALPATIYTLRR